MCNNSAIQSQKTFRLIPLITDLSKQKDWHTAKKEWEVTRIEKFDKDSGKQCLCGHHIQEVIHIYNNENHNRTIVGNCCIKLILSDLDQSHLFADIKRLLPSNKPLKRNTYADGNKKSSLDKDLKRKTLEYALSRNIITQLMFDTYYDTVSSYGYINAIIHRYVNYLIIKGIHSNAPITIQDDVICGLDVGFIISDILDFKFNGLSKQFLHEIDFRNKRLNKWYQQATNMKAEYIQEYYVKSNYKATPLNKTQKDFIVYYTILGVTWLLNETQDDADRWDLDLMEIFKLENPLPQELW